MASATRWPATAPRNWSSRACRNWLRSISGPGHQFSDHLHASADLAPSRVGGEHYRCVERVTGGEDQRVRQPELPVLAAQRRGLTGNLARQRLDAQGEVGDE